MKKLLPHVCLDLSVIFLVLVVIDQINPAMHFLSRNLFKIPLLIYLILVIFLAFQAILRQRASRLRAERKRMNAENNKY